MKYYRVDPARSAAMNLWIMDSDSVLAALEARDTDCSQGGHKVFPKAKLITHQMVTCTDTGGQLFTIIYQA
jgi:hypothetical protein